jgi:VWFA-related protein
LAALLSVALGGVGVSAGQQVPVFKSGIDLVNVGVTIADKRSNLVTDLMEGDFEIYEDGKKQTIRYFAAGEVVDDDHPGPALHLGVLLDVSESMGEDMTFTKTASIKFLNRLLDAVDITVVDFDTVRAAPVRTSSRASSSGSARRRRAASPPSTMRSASTSTVRPGRTGARSCSFTPTAAIRAARSRSTS